jgi:hypothetical protein
VRGVKHSGTTLRFSFLEAWRVKRQLKKELLELAVALLPLVRSGLPVVIALLELQRKKLTDYAED